MARTSVDEFLAITVCDGFSLGETGRRVECGTCSKVGKKMNRGMSGFGKLKCTAEW